MKNQAEAFRENHYIILRNVLAKPFCEIVTNYAKFQAFYDFTPEAENNAYVPNTHSRYADFLMESFLLFLQPIIEENIDRKLIPTYSYYRLYKQGDKLDPHVDRGECEVSASLAFGWPDTAPWPFKLANDKDYTVAFDESNIISPPESTINVILEPGDALIYAGPKVKHWREPFSGVAYVQAFFHYVYEDGPNANHKYDGRDAIGVPKISDRLEYFKYSDWMKALLMYHTAKNS